MKLLLDENMPGFILEGLRDAQIDAVAIWETTSSLEDASVLALARSSGRILLTLDKADFGELLFQKKVPAPPGVILWRRSFLSRQHAINEILAVLRSHTWTCCFSTVDDHRVRQRRLPA